MGVGMSDFPQGGDNFAMTGAWALDRGSAWHHWQCEALRAQVRASQAAGEPFAARRFQGALDRLKVAGPVPVRLPTGAGGG